MTKNQSGTGQKTNRTYFTTLIYGVIALILFLHIYSTYYPSGLNWGIHEMAFLPSMVSVMFLCFILIILNPHIQIALLSGLDRLIGFIRRQNSLLKSIAAIFALSIFIVIFWIGRENTPFLGDGFLVARSLPHLAHPSLIVESNYNNEPFSALAMYGIYHSLHGMGIHADGEDAYHVGSIIFGVMTLVTFWYLARSIVRNTSESILAYIFLLAGGGTQLFFGYVEDYAPLYWALSLFTVLGIAYLQEKISLVFVGISYAFLFLFHFGALIFFPLFLLSFYEGFRRKHFGEIILTILIMLPIIGLGLYITGYTPYGFLHHFKTASGASFFGHDQMTASYDLISFYHFVDVANLLLLLSPFALPCCIITGIIYFDRNLIRDRTLLFLTMSAVFGVAFIFGVNSLLGMSRDWDLFAPFGLPFCILFIYIWNRFIEDDTNRRRFMVVMTVITLLHTISWITVNAKSERSYKRFVMLGDDRLWSKKSLANAYDELSSYFSKYGNHREALYYSLKYLKIDSQNPRLLTNAGVSYSKLGDTAKALILFRKAADNGSDDKRTYFLVGKDLKKNHKMEEALYYLRLGLFHDSTSADANNEVGKILSSDAKTLDESLPYFLRAIRLDSAFADPYKNAAQYYSLKHNTGQMNYYVDKYLHLRPNDPEIQMLRQKMEENDLPGNLSQ
ncbi:MAG: tetratricopeptide repeat protein [Bacteroidota bacterium]